MEGYCQDSIAGHLLLAWLLWRVVAAHMPHFGWVLPPSEYALLHPDRNEHARGVCMPSGEPAIRAAARVLHAPYAGPGVLFGWFGREFEWGASRAIGAMR